MSTRPVNKNASQRVRSTSRQYVLAACACSGWLNVHAYADVVERRGTEPTIVGDIVAMDDGGVTVSSQFGARHFIPWDRVRRIEDDHAASDLQQRLAAAEDLWRARSRVERHDAAMAEPLFERLFESYRGTTSETALVVAEGLLRCRLSRQDHVLAVIPALEVARLRRANISTDSYARLESVYDGATALCPAIAPAWLPGRGLDRLHRELTEYNARGDDVVAALASLYRAAAAHAAGRAVDLPPLSALPTQPGVMLLQQIVACAPGGGQASADAAASLLGRLNDLPAWAQAWAHFRIGMSSLETEDRARQDAALLHLMHVPAVYGRTQPYLAGLALESAAGALAARGDSDAASALRAELARAYPHHPANHALTSTTH